MLVSVRAYNVFFFFLSFNFNFYSSIYQKKKKFLLLVVGRAPNTKRLNLEVVGVELDKMGAVKVVFYCFYAYLILEQHIHYNRADKQPRKEKFAVSGLCYTLYKV